MQSSHETYSQLSLPLFQNQCDVSTGAFAPAIAIAEAQHVTQPCNNPFRKNIVTCQDEYRDEFIDEVDGLEFNCPLNPASFDLPSYIPAVDRSAALRFRGIPAAFPVLATTLRDITASQLRPYAGSLHIPKSMRYHTNVSNVPTFAGKQILLMLSGHDMLIETVWHQRNTSGLYTAINQNNINLVTGFNFSLYNGECAFSQGLNLKKSLYSCFEMEQRGIPHPIPHIYAMNDHQIERWFVWLQANPTVRYCAMNCQVQRRPDEISRIVHIVSTLLLAIPSLRFILQGFRFAELHRFGALLHRIHIVDAVPSKYGHSRQIIPTSTGFSKRPAFDASRTPSEIAIVNMLSRQQDFENIKRQVAGSKHSFIHLKSKV